MGGWVRENGYIFNEVQGLGFNGLPRSEFPGVVEEVFGGLLDQDVVVALPGRADVGVIID